MKKTYFSLLLLPFFFIACSSGSNNKTAHDSDKQASEVTALTTISMEIKGMTCEGCENTIETALADIEGVVKVEASHQKAITVISYDSTKVKPQALTQTINDLGYQAIN